MNETVKKQEKELEKILNAYGYKKFLLIGLDQAEQGKGRVIFGGEYDETYVQRMIYGVAGMVVEIARRTEEETGMPTAYAAGQIMMDVIDVIKDSLPQPEKGLIQ